MSSTGRKITLKSSDGVTFEVDEVVALESQTIKHLIQLIEDGGAVDVIPLPNVTSKILSKVIEYCTKHVEAPKSDDRATSVDDELKTWDAYFVKVDRVTLRELKQAANYLEIKSLLDLMSQTFEDVTLMSSDGKTFEVDKSVALESQTIKLLIEDVGADDVIPLPNVTSKILSKVIEYCKKHVEAPKSDDRATSVDDELKAWDADFVKVDQATLFDLILAANYLNIKSLLDLTCQTVADMIKGKTPEEIRKTFNSKTFNSKDFTPEEEEEVRRENPWAFE